MKKLLILTACLMTFSLKADIFSALDAYEVGQFEMAYKQFHEMAAIGEKRAQFNLGVMYFQGQHVKKDVNKAYAWIRLATDSETMNENHITAFNQVEKEVDDKLLAESLYQQLVDQYSIEVLINSLYPMLVSTNDGASFNAEPKKIVEPRFPRKAALNGIQGWTRFSFDLDKNGVPRNIQLNESFPHGVFDEVSLKAIYKWRFQPAKDKQGNAIPQKNMKYTMQFTISGSAPVELKEGIYEEQLAFAKQGDANAQFNIGYFEKELDVSKGEENPNSWFLKAALQGQPQAQYELGQSLIYGQGCIRDQSKGVEWLTRAAYSGDRQAKLLLASISTQITTLDSHMRSIEYTKDIENLTSRVIIDQAWMYATSPFEQVKNPNKAIDLLDKLPQNSYKDDITTREIKAAAYAALGNFEEAIDYQEDALQEAEKRNADVEVIKTRLASYQSNKVWF